MSNNNKIGDVAIALTILVFVVAGFSFLFNNADQAAEVDSGLVKQQFIIYESELKGDVENLETGLTDKTDSTSTFNVEDVSTEVEQRGADAGGFLNIRAKNILVRFGQLLSDKIPGANIIIGLLASLVAIILSILGLRFFWGENKI